MFAFLLARLLPPGFEPPFLDGIRFSFCLSVCFFNLSARLFSISSTYPRAKGGKQYKVRHYFRPRQRMGETISLAHQRQLFWSDWQACKR
jgi:hypothetical protein